MKLSFIKNPSHTQSEEIKSHTTCPICFELFNEHNNIPFIYPCSHNICMRCHYKILLSANYIDINNISCPICKEQVGRKTPTKNLALLAFTGILNHNPDTKPANFENKILKKPKDSKFCSQNHKVEWVPGITKCSFCNQDRNCFQCENCKYNKCLKCSKYNFNNHPLTCNCKEYLKIDDVSIIHCSKCNKEASLGLTCFNCFYKICVKCFRKLRNQHFTNNITNNRYYAGEMLGGSYHGKGIFYDKLFGYYNGEFQNNKKNGFGIFKVILNDSMYVGHWKDDMRHGKGKYTLGNGQSYEGDFKNDIAHGKGIFIFCSGDKYIGDIKINKLTGNGAIYFNNGEKYTGRFLDGEFHGKGVYSYPDGTVFRGGHKFNKRHGRGVFHYPNGKEETVFYEYGCLVEKKVKKETKKIKKPNVKKPSVKLIRRYNRHRAARS